MIYCCAECTVEWNGDEEGSYCWLCGQLGGEGSFGYSISSQWQMVSVRLDADEMTYEKEQGKPLFL